MSSSGSSSSPSVPGPRPESAGRRRRLSACCSRRRHRSLCRGAPLLAASPLTLLSALLGSRAALLVADDEVDPLVQVRRDVVALERLAVARHEVEGVARPRRQQHVLDAHAVLPLVSSPRCASAPLRTSTLAISAGMSVTSNKQFASGLDILLNSTVELETLSAKARCRPA